VGGVIAPPTPTQRGTTMEIATDRRFYKDIMLWEASLKKSDVADLSDEQVKELTTELSVALQGILWNYGIHN
jgi:hypothetical protein